MFISILWKYWFLMELLVCEALLALCPEGWISNNSGCYKLLTAKLHYKEAENKCKNEHPEAVLPILLNHDDYGEFSKIISLLRPYERLDYFYINGQSEAGQRSYYQTLKNGKKCLITYFEWAYGQSSFFDDTKDSVLLYDYSKSGVFDWERNHIAKRYVICQIPINGECNRSSGVRKSSVSSIGSRLVLQASGNSATSDCNDACRAVQLECNFDKIHEIPISEMESKIKELLPNEECETPIGRSVLTNLPYFQKRHFDFEPFFNEYTRCALGYDKIEQHFPYPNCETTGFEKARRICQCGKSNPSITICTNGAEQKGSEDISCESGQPCPTNSWCNLGNDRSTAICCKKGIGEDNPCMLDKKTGTGNATLKLHYYNKDKDECEFFTYFGTEGNPNMFSSKEECESVCKICAKGAALGGTKAVTRCHENTSVCQKGAFCNLGMKDQMVCCKNVG